MTVFQLITDKVQRGVLPCDKPLKLWAGYGNGRRCDGCDKPIMMNEIERELDMPDASILRFHIVCEAFWRSATAN